MILCVIKVPSSLYMIVPISQPYVQIKNFQCRADTQDCPACTDPRPPTNTCMMTPTSTSGETMKCPEKQSSLCMLCEEPVTVKLLPCGHAQICILCVKRAKKCPLCKV